MYSMYPVLYQLATGNLVPVQVQVQGLRIRKDIYCRHMPFFAKMIRHFNFNYSKLRLKTYVSSHFAKKGHVSTVHVLPVYPFTHYH